MNSDKRHFYPDGSESGGDDLSGRSSCAGDSESLSSQNLPSSDLARRTCVRLWDEIGRMEEDSAAMELSPSPFSSPSNYPVSKVPKDFRLTPKFPAFKRSSTKTTPFILKRVSVYDESGKILPHSAGSSDNQTPDKHLPYVVSPITVRTLEYPSVISPITLSAEEVARLRVSARPASRSSLALESASSLADSLFPVSKSDSVRAVSKDVPAVLPKLATPSSHPAEDVPVSAEQSAAPIVLSAVAPAVPSAVAPAVPSAVAPAVPSAVVPAVPSAVPSAVAPAVPSAVPSAVTPVVPSALPDGVPKITAINPRISLYDISREFARERVRSDKTRRRRFRSPLINGEIREELKDEYYWEILPSENESEQKRRRPKKKEVLMLPERELFGIYKNIPREERWEPNLVTAMLVEPVIFVGHTTLLVMSPIRRLFRWREGAVSLPKDEIELISSADGEGKKKWFIPFDFFLALIFGVAIAALAIFPLILKLSGDVYQTVRQSNVRRFSNSVSVSEQTPSFLHLLLYPPEAIEEINGHLVTPNTRFTELEYGNSGFPASSSSQPQKEESGENSSSFSSDFSLDEFESPESESNGSSQKE